MSTSRSRTAAAPPAHAKCMRSHGVPNLPDPQFSTAGGRVRIGIGIKAGGPGVGGGPDAGSPILQKAQSECGSLLPGPVSQTKAPAP